MTSIQRAILHALRHGALNPVELAKELDEALFRVNAELKALRRERLVTERLGRTEHVWRLTDAGNELAWAAEQRELFR